MSLRYHAIDSPSLLLDSKSIDSLHVVILGEKANLVKHASQAASDIKTTIGLPQATQHEAAVNKVITALAERLAPSSDGTASLDTHLHIDDLLLRVSLAALPSCTPSRHASPSKPHAAADIVKSYARGNNPLKILLLLSSPDHALALGTACARAFPLYSRKSSPQRPPRQVDVVFSLPLAELGGQEVLDKISALADGIQLVCRLVDAPPNELHTDEFVREAMEVQKRVGEGRVGVTVIRGEQLKEQGLGGIYGVGRAAEHPPALCILSLNEGSEGKAVAWVGKGIVYDTGGLSIKGKSGMPGMKRDMGGAAAILAAFEATARLGYNNGPLYALLCLAENSVDSVATRPDDIHLMYSGKTVEINNTDAEGRLVLSDGVAYAAKNLNPSVIIDMATLTGAQGVSTGKRHAALYCNNEELETVAVEVGKATGDLAHGMPYCPEFFQMEFRSAVADMKNSVANRENAQVSCAGQFIGSHLGDWLQSHRWLHIDMAYPVHIGERATGYGVNLLHELLHKI